MECELIDRVVTPSTLLFDMEILENNYVDYFLHHLEYFIMYDILKDMTLKEFEATAQIVCQFEVCDNISFILKKISFGALLSIFL